MGLKAAGAAGKKEVILCPGKMVQVPAATGPAKGRAGATPARVDKAGAGEAQKGHAVKVVAVRAEGVAVAGTQGPASLHPQPPDGQLPITGVDATE